MTDLRKTHRAVKDENGKWILVPIVKRYDASTEAKRAGNANKSRPASRRKALSVKKVDHV